MKILAVRGKNLTSLSEFDIDFTDETLGNAGVFGIIGPTGAGKSTLLDAMCLALFGTTPRTSDGEITHIGNPSDRQRLANSRDPRALLRQGASEGFAEVEFSTTTGRYRSQWAVRRARDKANGNLQKVTIRIFEWRNDEWSEVGSGRATESLGTLRGWIGLDFDQFCRAVLLAQGDFAAFLKASRNEKTEILERLTQTEIYRKISRHTYQRFQSAESELTGKRQRLEDLAVLTPEERQALDAKVAKLDSQFENLEAEKAALIEICRWFETRASLAQSLAEAEKAAKDAAAKLAAARELREECDRAERVGTISHLIGTADQHRKDVASAAAKLETSKAAKNAATAAESAATEKLGIAVEEQREANARSKKLAPEIKAAQQLDAKLTDALSTKQYAEEQAREAKKAASVTRDKFETLRKSKAEIAAQILSSKQWLDEHRATREIAEQWERWSALIDKYINSESSRRGLQSDADAAKKSLDTAKQAAASIKGKLADAKKKLAEATKKLEARKAAYDRAAESELESERDSLAANARLLGELAAIAGAARSDRRELMAQREKHSAAVDAENKALECAKTAAAEQNAAEVKLVKWQKVRDGLRAALDLADHRAELRQGVACPLCGSHDHPWRIDKPDLAQPDLEANRMIGELETTIRTARDREIEAKSAAEQAEKDAEAATHEIDSIETRMRAAEKKWKTKLKSLPAEFRKQIAAVDAETTEIRLADAIEKVDADIKANAGKLRRSGQAHDACDDAEKIEHAARRTFDEIETLDAEAREKLLACEKAFEFATLKLDANRNQSTEVIDELAAVFDNVDKIWRKELSNDSRKFRTRWEQEATNWRASTAKLEQAMASSAALDLELAAVETSLKFANETAQDAQKKSDSAIKTHRKLAEDRLALLDGEDVEVIEADLAREIEAADKAVGRAQKELRTAAGDKVRADAECKSAKQLHEKSAKTLTKTESHLKGDLAKLSVSEAEARQILATRNSRWIEATRKKLRDWEEAKNTAEAVRDERQRNLDAHTATSPSASESTTRERLQTIDADITRVGNERMAEKFRQKTDDANREQAEALMADLDEVSERVKTLAMLNDLIGSASGDKFARYAQALAFDDLLVHANDHLLRLHPRYRLQRVPGQELSLQVIDTEMADEIRPASTLSGGETFLVSLALALALSAICSHQMPIESLFIDEGFGTLDPDTLDVALGVLDQLQAAGRQIGVISHVPGMAERLAAIIDVRPIAAGESRVQILTSVAV